MRIPVVEDEEKEQSVSIEVAEPVHTYAVEVNGGYIEIESKEGHGSTFRNVLPQQKIGSNEDKTGRKDNQK